MAESENVVKQTGDSCTFEPVGRENKLKICWCKKMCLLGEGAYGSVYKGKWKQESPEASESIDVAVKHQEAGPYHVDYEIAALTKANGHSNILKFYGQIEYPPNRYDDVAHVTSIIRSRVLNYIYKLHKSPAVSIPNSSILYP